MFGLDPTSFAGVFEIIAPNRPADQLDADAVADDIEGECETLPVSAEAAPPDAATGKGEGVTTPNLEGDDVPRVAELLTTVKDVSRGVSDRTHDEYRR